MFPEAVGSAFDIEFHRVMETGETALFESYYPPPDLWVAVRAFPSEDGLAVYFLDIKAQRTAAESLARSEGRYRALFERAGDAILIADDSGRYSEGGDLVFERTFDAPREQVWKAFTDPEIVPRWWGPHGTTTTVAEMDVRPGGKWRYVSQAPDRDEVSFYGEYLEIDPPRGFKWTFLFDVDGVGPQGGAETFTFEDVDGRTKVTSVGHMGSTEARDRLGLPRVR